MQSYAADPVGIQHPRLTFHIKGTRFLGSENENRRQ